MDKDLASAFDELKELIVKCHGDDNSFKMLLDSKIVEAFNIAKAHGWHDEDRNDGEMIALMHSELSEALQALRNGNPLDKHCPGFSALEVELADVVIRIMDYSHMRSLDLSGAILAKMQYNKQRPHKHGGKLF